LLRVNPIKLLTPFTLYWC